MLPTTPETAQAPPEHQAMEFKPLALGADWAQAQSHASECRRALGEFIGLRQRERFWDCEVSLTFAEDVRLLQNARKAHIAKTHFVSGLFAQGSDGQVFYIPRQLTSGRRGYPFGPQAYAQLVRAEFVPKEKAKLSASAVLEKVDRNFALPEAVLREIRQPLPAGSIVKATEFQSQILRALEEQFRGPDRVGIDYQPDPYENDHRLTLRLSRKTWGKVECRVSLLHDPLAGLVRLWSSMEFSQTHRTSSYILIAKGTLLRLGTHRE